MIPERVQAARTAATQVMAISERHGALEPVAEARAMFAACIVAMRELVREPPPGEAPFLSPQQRSRMQRELRGLEEEWRRWGETGDPRG
jgi:hypothetical protein